MTDQEKKHLEDTLPWAGLGKQLEDPTWAKAFWLYNSKKIPLSRHDRKAYFKVQQYVQHTT